LPGKREREETKEERHRTGIFDLCKFRGDRKKRYIGEEAEHTQMKIPHLILHATKSRGREMAVRALPQ